jgi:hypothetical protein
MEQPEAHDDDVKLPEDRVEDLEPTDDDAEDVRGGIIQKAGGGNLKAD